jgi:hypothetical protein
MFVLIIPPIYLFFSSYYVVPCDITCIFNQFHFWKCDRLQWVDIRVQTAELEVQLILVISNSMGPWTKFESTVVQLKRSYENTGSVVCLTTKGRQLEQNFEELKPVSHVPILGMILNIFDIFVAVFFSLLNSLITSRYLFLCVWICLSVLFVFQLLHCH